MGPPDTDSMAFVVILAKSEVGSAISGEFISRKDKLREREWALELVEPVRDDCERLLEVEPLDEHVPCPDTGAWLDLGADKEVERRSDLRER